MPADDLIATLNKILYHADQRQVLNSKTEAPEARVARHLEFLKGIQYKPKDPAGLKTGLLLGEKKQLLPIFHFVLSNFESIKERAYLARFLLKIAVPAEMIQSDEEIHSAWSEYLELIERFKEIHSAVTEQRKQGPDTEAVRKDIRQMEEERKQIEKRVERAETKAKTIQNYDSLATGLIFNYKKR